MDRENVRRHFDISIEAIMRHPWRTLALLPAPRVLLIFSTGVLLQWHLRWPGDSLLPVSCMFLGGAAACTLIERRQHRFAIGRDIFLALLIVSMGMLRLATVLEGYSTDLLRFADRKEKLLLHGTVADDPRIAADRQRFLLDASHVRTEGDSQRVTGRVLCSYRKSAWDEDDTLQSLRAGDVVSLHCRLRVPRLPRNPGAFDSRTWVLQEGAALQASVSKGSDLHLHDREQSPAWKRVVSETRMFVRRAIAALFTPEHAAVMNGLVLGDRSGIDDGMIEDFRRSGIMHILAVSGLHAGIVLSLVFFPLERLRFPLRAAVALGLLWLYAAITGFAPPVTRASLMATLFLGGTIAQRTGHGVNTLATAGIVILAIDPLAVLGLSFQLSFGAVLGILLFSDRIAHAWETWIPSRLRGRVSDALLALLALTLSAQSLTLPLLAMNFGQVSLSGLLTNLIAVPLTFVVVTGAVLAVLVFVISPAVAALCAATASTALDMVILSSDIMAEVPFAVLDIPALGAIVWILYLVLLAYLAGTIGRLRQKLPIVALALLAAYVCGLFTIPSAPARLRITFLDVGQGDAILIEYPGEAAWLVDTGPGDARMNSGTHVILPVLRAAGIDRLGALVITHPDNDHAGGAAAVLEQMRVDRVLTSCAWSDSGETGALTRIIHDRAGEMRDVRAGDCFDFGPAARIHILSPPAMTDCVPSNGSSVVLMIVHGRVRILLTGDTDIDAEGRMCARYGQALRADLLKVAHHGSTTSSDPAFLAMVRPRHAVITVGRNNRFHHPRPDVVARLLRIGARVHRTDITGALMFESDGRNLWKRAWE
ncbi:MAG: DNA internalization-related competence protein ComEC/Rec2 [Bacteroidota bacterium]|nr:DNA internalization-related competence protein ComEC/Rec2 [Bacteroidota bacterium]